ncbi:hypothetical protein [Corynebacterium pyruviciproducens]
MIEVTVINDRGERVGVRFETNAVEVIDGALIIYTFGAKDYLAGFAPGAWAGFQRLDVEG